MNFEKQIFVDSDNIPHLFESNSSGINYTYKSNDSWTTEIVNPTTSGSRCTAFNGLDKLYLIYGYNNNIYFQTKQTTGIVEYDNNIIKDFNLNSYPNPFNNETVISFSIDKISDVILNIFNLQGQLVNELVNSRLNKGNHSYIFKASKNNSGTYFAVLKVGNEKEVKKMLYLR